VRLREEVRVGTPNQGNLGKSSSGMGAGAAYGAGAYEEQSWNLLGPTIQTTQDGLSLGVTLRSGREGDSHGYGHPVRI
jgi:hypothetical protein